MKTNGSLIRAAATCALTSAAALAPAMAQDAYVIGVSGAITGPAAATYAPAVDGLRIYIDGVNARGGINGRQIRLVVQDNQGEASRGAADAKRLLTQDNVLILLNASLSATYAPMLAEAKRAGVPVLFASAVCPKEVYPPADPLQFCTTAFAANHDSRATLDFVKTHSKEPVRIGLAAMAIPISRAEIDYAEQLSKQMGMTPVDKAVIPPPTADYTPFATKLRDANPNWMYSWAPWVTQVRTLESMRRLGWNGNFIAWAHLNAEDELARLKDGNFYVIGANSFFQDGLPIHKEIRDAAAKASSQYPPTQMTEGWIAGMVVEQILKQAGWPTSPEKVAAAMSSLKVDTKGLRGGPIEWTKDNHFRTRQYYRIYRWDPAANAIVRTQDWQGVDVK